VCDLVHVQFTHEIVLYVLYVKALSTKNKPFHPWVKWLWQSNKAAMKNTKRNQIMSSTMECNSVFYLPLFLCHQTTWKGKGVCGERAGGGGGLEEASLPLFWRFDVFGSLVWWTTNLETSLHVCQPFFLFNVIFWDDFYFQSPHTCEGIRSPKTTF
jgi:hypothetical protein